MTLAAGDWACSGGRRPLDRQELRASSEASLSDLFDAAPGARFAGTSNSGTTWESGLRRELRYDCQQPLVWSQRPTSASDRGTAADAGSGASPHQAHDLDGPSNR